MDSWIMLDCSGVPGAGKTCSCEMLFGPRSGVKPNDRSRPPLAPPKIAQIPNQSAAGSGI